jgi:Zn-dependent peptidase ImmA (M78 family)
MTKCINKARELLVKQDITSFALNIEQMRFAQAIYFDTFAGYSEAVGIPESVFYLIKDGCAVIKGDVHIVLTRKTIPQRQRWTLAHEIGHICLGHTCDNMSEERQANSFASELLLPELVVLELQKRLGRTLMVSEAAELFGVSRSATQSKLNTVAGKEIYSAYLKSEIMSKYDSLIENYVKKHGKKICLTM